MKKYLKDFSVIKSVRLSSDYGLLGLRPSDGSDLPEMAPGQFVEVTAPAESGVMLRRPISIHDVDFENNLLWLLVRNAGKGTAAMISLQPGDTVNILLPLGNGFTLPDISDKPLLIGGGVGVAPLLYFGKEMSRNGLKPSFLLGAKSKSDLLRIDCFEKVGPTYITTEDGTEGEKGFVTNHSALTDGWTKIYCCGPVPMMRAVARIARQRDIDCEVSLENMMACGLGACLCCVENTVKGNVCVCNEGPVFNINQLLWQD